MTETMSTHGLVAELATTLEQMGNELDELLAPLADWQWSTDTPAEGWTIAHQIAHLAWTDRQSLAALDDPEAFDRVLDAAAEDPARRLADAIVAADPGVPVRWGDVHRVSLQVAVLQTGIDELARRIDEIDAERGP